MKKLIIITVLLGFSISVLAQHTLDFVIPPCEHVENKENKIKDCELAIFPNPVSDNFTVELYNGYSTEIVSFEIYNILGKLLSSKVFKVNKGINKLEIDVSDFDAGTYILKFKINREIIHKKIIVQ